MALTPLVGTTYTAPVKVESPSALADALSGPAVASAERRWGFIDPASGFGLGFDREGRVEPQLGYMDSVGIIFDATLVASPEESERVWGGIGGFIYVNAPTFPQLDKEQTTFPRAS